MENKRINMIVDEKSWLEFDILKQLLINTNPELKQIYKNDSKTYKLETIESICNKLEKTISK